MTASRAMAPWERRPRRDWAPVAPRAALPRLRTDSGSTVDPDSDPDSDSVPMLAAFPRRRTRVMDCL